MLLSRYGWRNYEAMASDIIHGQTQILLERRDGTTAAGKSILVYMEQGFGDTITCAIYPSSRDKQTKWFSNARRR